MRAIGQQSRPIVLRASRYAPRAAARSEEVQKTDGASGAPLMIPHAAIHPLAERPALRRPAASASVGPKEAPTRPFDGCAPNSPAPLSRDPDLGSLRTLPHGSGRSPASRDEPLTPGTRRPLRRGAACGAERAASGRPYQRSINPDAMPTCSRCFHGGKDHDWTSPPCSILRCICILDHPRRVRGRCRVPRCPCGHYEPLGGQPKPVNPYIGRARR